MTSPKIRKRKCWAANDDDAGRSLEAADGAGDVRAGNDGVAGGAQARKTLEAEILKKRWRSRANENGLRAHPCCPVTIDEASLRRPECSALSSACPGTPIGQLDGPRRHRRSRDDSQLVAEIRCEVSVYYNLGGTPGESSRFGIRGLSCRSGSAPMSVGRYLIVQHASPKLPPTASERLMWFGHMRAQCLLQRQ
jgi:hypothetical protein